MMSSTKDKAFVKTRKKGVRKTSSSYQNISDKKLNGIINHNTQNSSMHEFSLLKEISGYSNEDLAALVGITYRTISNKKSNGEFFNIAQTERLRKLNQLFQEGNVIFNNKLQFNEWLQKPAYSLDYNIPADLLQQPGGLDKVMSELNSIKFGDTI